MQHDLAVVATEHKGLAGEKARSRNASQKSCGRPVANLNHIPNAKVRDQIGRLVEVDRNTVIGFAELNDKGIVAATTG